VKPHTKCTDPDAGRLLAAYDAGILDPQEQVGFERHVESCEACREELFEIAPHMALLHQHPGSAATALGRLGPLAEGAGAPRHAPNRWLAALRSLWAPPARPAARRWWWAALVPAVAAAVLVAVFLGEHGDSGRWAALAEREALPFTRMETRAPGDPTVADFDAGMDLYLAADYAAAAAKLAGTERRIDRQRIDPAVKSFPPARLLQRADQAALYAGIAFLLADRGDSARVHLDRAAHARMASVADHARWYLAQAALLEGEPQAASEQLRLLSDSPAYSERAAAKLTAIGAQKP
jgi:hypothetical protein